MFKLFLYGLLFYLLYQTFISPFFIEPPRQRPSARPNVKQNQQSTKQSDENNDDDGEYIEYEEIK